MAKAQNANLIDTKTAAALIKVTPRRIQQLAKDGWFKAKGRGKWSLVEVVQGYIDFLADERARNSKVAAGSRLSDARAREIEIRTARLDRQVIDLDEATPLFDQLAGEFMQSLGGLPARITRVPRERQRIEAIIDGERQRISDRFAKIANTLATGIDDDEAGGEGDAG